MDLIVQLGTGTTELGLPLHYTLQRVSGEWQVFGVAERDMGKARPLKPVDRCDWGSIKINGRLLIDVVREKTE